MAAVPKFASAATIEWKKLNTEKSYSGKQDDIHFINFDIGFYGNGSGKLYKTKDGGENWEKIWDRPGTFIRALGFADENTGFIGNIGTDYYPGVTDENPLYKTRDGGKSFSIIEHKDIGIVKGICGIHILKKKRIYQGQLVESAIIHAAGRVGSPAAIMRSTDNGETFTIFDLKKYAAMAFDVFFHSPNVGFICASSHEDIEKGNALVLRTTDGCKTFEIVYKSGRYFENCWKMSWVNENIGFATIQTYNETDIGKTQRIIKTINGGKTWFELPLVEDIKAREFGIGFVDKNLGFVGTRIGGFQTDDGGKTFRPNNLGPAINKMRILRKGGQTRAFAVGLDVWRADF